MVGIVKHMKPREALDLLQNNPDAVLVDCRSEMEYLFVGHPEGAHHVAWNDGPDWEINPHFVGQVQKIASLNRPVVLICRSGQRSIDAGIALVRSRWSPQTAPTPTIAPIRPWRRRITNMTLPVG